MLEISSNCTKCGICAEDCPAQIIILENNNTPSITISANCIKCGHCEAVCPNSALKNSLLSHKESDKKILATSKDPIIAENFLRSRRSIRCFKNKQVPKDEVSKLVNIGRYAQTGSNSQGVSYKIVTTEQMDKMRDLTMDFLLNSDDNFARKLYDYFSNSKSDILFRGAPMCIMALTEKSNPYTEQNARFALTYIELFAPTLGLGTCWAGYFERYTKTNSDKLRNLLEIPDNLVISSSLLFGYPKYNYHELIERDDLKIYW